MAESTPKFSLRSISKSDNYAALIDKLIYNFETIYTYGGGPPGPPAEPGKKGDPGATLVPTPGPPGKRGSVFSFYPTVLADQQVVSSLSNPLQYNEHDVIVDSNYVHFEVLINSVGIYYLQRRLGLLGPEDIGNKAIDFTIINNTLYPTVEAVENRIALVGSGFEVATNKVTDFSTINNILYPTVQAVKTQLDLKEVLANKATDFITVNNTLYPTVQAVDTQKLDKIDTVVVHTGSSFNPSSTDFFKLHDLGNATTVTIQITPGIGTKAGQWMQFRQGGNGAIFFDPATGCTYQARLSLTGTNRQYSIVTAVYMGSDTWWIYGDLA